MELTELRNRIDAANTAYWQDHQPIMPDQEYDKLIEQLRILDPTDPRLNYIGGSQGTVVHNPPMLSLDKKYSHEELIKWCESVSRTADELFVVQPKYDGIAVKMTYDNQRLQLSTRGDGHIGEDISDKVPYIKLVTNDGISLKIWKQQLTEPLSFPFILYGELVITNTDFNTYFQSGKYLRKDGERYTTQRNAVAGMASLKDVTFQEGDQPLTLVEYQSCEQVFPLRELKDPENWERLLEEIQDLDYPLDGIVVKLVDPLLHSQLGATQHHPRWAMAYKFANEHETSRILDIEWNVGMRSITPKAVIEPVKIGDVTVSQASLFNLRYVIQNHFSIGDQVKVERAGDVVPHICPEEHVHIGQELNIPSHCPSCGQRTHQEDVELVCTNPDCPGVLLAKFQKAAKELKLDGFGKVVLSTLIQHGVHNLQTLLSLEQESFQKYGFGDKTAINLSNSIQAARRSTTPAKLLSAMGIPRISKATAATLLVTCPIEDLISHSPEQLAEVLAMHGENGKSLVNWISQKENMLTLTVCMMLCTNLHSVSNTFEPTVCFTGKMSVTKSALSDYAKIRGYRVVDDVTKGLDLLVVPDDEDYLSDKLRKARRYGIEILTETQFRNK